MSLACDWHLRDRVVHLGERPLIMGIVNVTPDSFFDGGRYATPEAAVAHGLDLVQQGADLLDIGGESTRPGSMSVSLEEELRRVVPVIRELAGRCDTILSIDTSKAEVARQALDAGAQVVNDVTALRGAADMAAIVHTFRAGVILMHMQGTPATMQKQPTYQDVVREVAEFLESRLQAAADVGIAAAQVVLDPGIGFGKTHEHNLRLIARLEDLQRLKRPVCLGVSRKGFLSKIARRPPEQRVAGSLAVACFALAHKSAQILRVHDVAETRDAVEMFRALEDMDEPRP